MVFGKELLGLAERPGQRLDQQRCPCKAGDHGDTQGGNAADEHPTQILHVLKERLDRSAVLLAVLIQFRHRVIAVGVATAATRNRQRHSLRCLDIVSLIFLVPVVVMFVVMRVVIVVFVVLMIRIIVL